MVCHATLFIYFLHEIMTQTNRPVLFIFQVDDVALQRHLCPNFQSSSNSSGHWFQLSKSHPKKLEVNRIQVISIVTCTRRNYEIYIVSKNWLKRRRLSNRLRGSIYFHLMKKIVIHLLKKVKHWRKEGVCGIEHF